MEYRIASVTEVDDKPALEELLTEYYAVVFHKLTLAGGTVRNAPKDMASTVVANIQTVLPPTGRLVLAYGKQNRLVGCGTLQQARPDANEISSLNETLIHLNKAANWSINKDHLWEPNALSYQFCSRKYPSKIYLKI